MQELRNPIPVQIRGGELDGADGMLVCFDHDAAGALVVVPDRGFHFGSLDDLVPRGVYVPSGGDVMRSAGPCPAETGLGPCACGGCGPAHPARATPENLITAGTREIGAAFAQHLGVIPAHMPGFLDQFQRLAEPLVAELVRKAVAGRRA